MRWRPLAATALVLLAAAAPAAAAEPVLPLADVRPGMQCTGLTVVQGVEVSEFDVEIVDVVVGDRIDGQPLLLVRVSGPVAAPSGIAQGFSGSPVVCDGRIAGAIAYGTGDYGNELGFATPIEAVLGEHVRAPRDARHAPRLVRRARPLATPLSVAGVAPRVFAPFARAAQRIGLPLSVVPAAPVGDRFAPQTLRPGSSMAVGLSNGDVAVSGVGTVTYVDGDRVWGFGHPFEGVGRRALLLQDAYVYAVVDNPLGFEGAVSYKLAAPGHDLGTITTDGRDAVGGVLGPLPPRIPLRIVARDGDAREGAAGARRVVRARIADETGVGLPSGFSPASLVAPMAVAQAAYATLGAAPVDQSARMCLRLWIRELERPAGFCNRYAGAFGGFAELAGLGGPYTFDVYEALAAVDGFRYGTPHLERIDVRLELRRGSSEALLRSISGPRVLRRGGRVTLRLHLQHPRGDRFTRRVRFTVPAGAPLGPRRLQAIGAPGAWGGGEGILLDEEILLGGGPPSSPRTFRGLRRQIESIERVDRVLYRLAPPRGRARGPKRPLLRRPADRITGTAAYRVRVVPARRGAARKR